MTSNQHSMDRDGGMSSTLRKTLITAVAGPVSIFAAGAFAGFTTAVIERGGPSALDLGIMAGLGLTLLLVPLCAWKLWPAGEGELLSDSTRKARNMLIGAMGVGLVLGIYFAIATGPGELRLFSNDPINSQVAIVGIAVWALLVPIITWKWWRTVDEHEAAAYSDGGLIAAHLYLILVPAWWLATRAGWLPEQDPMIVFCIIGVIWSATWLYRRFV
ncbi:hypothetical protein [uncultured Erythrobacter sp.]|uniref:hypothetical protein n=1 Tax=uncultured Erythrobacter sp. TaxID=263913 RepID=UPI002605DF2D|nr:hypothetical protein [uncultured Erythrobacter sp.]